VQSRNSCWVRRKAVRARQRREVVSGVLGCVCKTNVIGEAGVLHNADVVACVNPFSEDGLLLGAEVEWGKEVELRGNSDDELFGEDELVAFGRLDDELDARVASDRVGYYGAE